MTRTVFAAALCAGCAIAEPFEGPMYSTTEGWTEEEPQQDYVVAVTYFRFKTGGDIRDLFDSHVSDITDSIDDQPGYVGRSLRSAIPGRERWTLTVWTDEAAMYEFVAGPVHASAMADVALMVDTAKTTHFTARASEIPVPWDLALARLDEVDAAYEAYR